MFEQRGLASVHSLVAFPQRNPRSASASPSLVQNHHNYPIPLGTALYETASHPSINQRAFLFHFITHRSPRNFPFPFAFNSPVNTRKLHYQIKTYPSLAAPTWKLTTISFLFSLCGFGCGWQDCEFLSPCISFLFLVYFEWR